MFAIQNKRTAQFVFGTDYRFHPPRQRTSMNKLCTYESAAEANADRLNRRCGRDYVVVEIEVRVVEGARVPPPVEKSAL